MLDIDKGKIDIDKETSQELEGIRQWLEKVKFAKQFIGGISEVDVWKKIEELNSMYEDALRAEKIRYETLLEEYKKKDIAANTKD